MSQERDLEQMIQPVLESMGYALVRVLVAGGQQPNLQVMAERSDGRPMSVDDCAQIARVLSAKLDVEDPIAGSYTLEVSSPGIDRPLIKRADYARFAGYDARVELKTPIAGRRRFSGRILAASETHVRLGLAEGEVELPFAEIMRAKLLLTEALIAAATNKSPETRH
jgi:ribosome maturation factor RimP